MSINLAQLQAAGTADSEIVQRLFSLRCLYSYISTFCLVFVY